MFLNIEQKIGYIPELHEFKSNTGNTAIAHHSKKTFALVEVDYPFQIKVEKNPKDFDIKPIGHDDFDEQLKHNVSAHPKVDKRSGHFCAFGYGRSKACVHYSLFNKDRKLLNYVKIPTTSIRMLHDFAITENYIIVPDLPMEVDIK